MQDFDELLGFEPTPDPLHLEGSPIHEDEFGNVTIGEELDHAPQPEIEEDHNQNLANVIPENILSTIISDLDMAIESDINSRDPWMNILADGVKYNGMKVEQRTKPYDGACGVYSSAQMQAILSTGSTIVGETMPPCGPAKRHISGFPSEEKENVSERLEYFFNYYFTKLNKAFYPDYQEAILMHLVPSGGVPFKIYLEAGEKWPSIFYIKPQDFIVNTSATSLHMATRITHVLTLTPRELIMRQMAGMYREVDIAPTSELESNNNTNYEQQIQQIRGIIETNKEYNPEYTCPESHVYLDLGKYDERFKDETNLPKPYRITYEKNSKKCLGFYNNWKENDPTFKRKNCFVNFNFIPGFGIYGTGYYHLLTGNAMAATALQRQLIDLGSLSNFPGGLRKKGIKFTESEILVGPGDFIEVDTGNFSLDQCFMPMPYPQPSPILKELKDDLEESMMQLAGAANTTLTEAPANMPATTLLAIIEQNQIVQSSIMQRVHRALTDMFEILFEVFKECIGDDPYPFHINGKTTFIMKKDFTDDITIIPASDPNLSSFPKRALTAEALLNTAKEFPDLHNMYNVLKRYYEVMNIGNIDQFLNKPEEEQQPMPVDPISENSNAIQGKPLKAFMTQDHKAHNTVHDIAINDPNTPPEAIPALQAHKNEHTAMDMMISMFQQIGMEVPEDPSQLPPEQQNHIAMMASQLEQQKQAQQEPPLTPEQVLLEEVKVKEKQIELESQYKKSQLDLDRQRLELEGIKVEQQQEKDEKQLEIDELKIREEAETQREKIKLESYKAHLDHHNEAEKIYKTEPRIEKSEKQEK